MGAAVKLLVTGAGGLLGSEIVREAERRGQPVDGLTHAQLDVGDPQAVRAVLERARPGVVIHCAAYTAVDRAESEPERARAVNRDGARRVAEAAAMLGIRMVYISTDYVFDGKACTPYLPGAATAPRSVYGRTKLEGERVTRKACPEALIVRTSWLYGAGGRGFVPAIVERARRGEPLRVVRDQVGRPTLARDAAEAVLGLTERAAEGIWHVAGGGEASWHDLALEALRLSGLDTPVSAVTSEEFGAKAPRPAYSVLDISATEALLGRPMPHWKDALGRYLDEASPA